MNIYKCRQATNYFIIAMVQYIFLIAMSNKAEHLCFGLKYLFTDMEVVSFIKF